MLPAGPPINCVVHVLMYAYYGMCALGPRYRDMMAAVKKYMTLVQLVRRVPGLPFPSTAAHAPRRRSS